MKSIMKTEKGICYQCGIQARTQEHHIFYGSNRKLSTRYGLTVHLCLDCHTGSRNGVHRNRENDMRLKIQGQKAFESKHGSREDFRRIFGRNYIWT